MTNREKAEELYEYIVQRREIPGGVVDCYVAIEKALSQSESDALERAAAAIEAKPDCGCGRRLASKIRALKPPKGTDVEK